jgi:DNA-binding NtrC family response regulator
MGKILVVDDDSSLRQAVCALLTRNGYEAASATGGREALELLADRGFDVAITDLRMDEMSGLDLLKRIRANFPEVEVILLTAYGSISTAVEAMRAEAFDYVTKPFKNEELLVVIEKALERRKLLSEVKYLREVVNYKYNFGTIIGQSPAIRKVTDLVAKAAREDMPVLIRGESGTGKELVAKAIHDNSRRKNRKFIAVNCAAIPDGLLETELFGHVKGKSHKGSDKVGLFAEADGGTIFLDDIADTSLALQAKIITVIEQNVMEPIGATECKKVDVRVVTATRHDLDDAVRHQRFREDLCAKLSMVPIELPALCDRGEDILLLAEHFIKKYTREFGRQPAVLTADAARTLLSYTWPGNVRELENAMKRTVALAKADRIRREDLVMVTDNAEGPRRLIFKSKSDNGMSLRDKELEFILKSLRENNWNYTRTAKQLGIGRTTLWRKMKKMRESEKVNEGVTH